MPKKGARLIAVALLCTMLLAGAVAMSSCARSGGSFKNGYYTAEMAKFDDKGWKEYVTIGVSGGKIVTVEFNAKNESGFIKAWDMAYMRRMNAQKGTYPTRYTRTYAASLIKSQSANQIDAVAGASVSGWNFSALVSAALENAKKGDHSVAIVGG